MVEEACLPEAQRSYLPYRHQAEDDNWKQSQYRLSNHVPSDVLPPSRLHLPKPCPNSSTNSTFSSAGAYGVYFSFKSSQYYSKCVLFIFLNQSMKDWVRNEFVSSSNYIEMQYKIQTQVKFSRKKILKVESCKKYVWNTKQNKSTQTQAPSLFCM